MKCVNLSLLLAVAVISTGLTAQAQQGISPAQLEVGLNFVSIAGYTAPNNGQDYQILIPSCTGTYEACMTNNVLPGYAAQGVTGVRFFFDITGSQDFFVDYMGNKHDGAPFDRNQNFTLRTDWLNNLSLFFRDLKNANITNVTPSPTMSGINGTWGTMGLAYCHHTNTNGIVERVPLGDTFSDNTTICQVPPDYPGPVCAGTPPTYNGQPCTTPDILYFPWLPFAVAPFPNGGGFPYKGQNANSYGDFVNTPSLAQDPSLAQFAWGWQDTGCVNWTGGPDINGSLVTWHGGPLPPGCSPFILFFRQLVRAATLAGLTIEEVDLNNEADLEHWPAIARLIWDNNQYSYQSSPGTGIFDLLSGIMTSLNSNYKAGRVTMSGTQTQYPGLPNGPGSAAHDCGSYYGDSQTMIGQSEIIAAVGQGYIGAISYCENNNPKCMFNGVQYNDPQYKLHCFTAQDQSIPQTNLFPLPGRQQQPTINDQHPTPGAINGDLADSGFGSIPPYSWTDAETVARTVYSDFWQMLENHSPPRCGGCTDITGNIVMLGETNAPNPGVASNEPSYPQQTVGNAAGLVSSQLQSDEFGHNHLSKVVVRPWVDNSFQIPAQIGWPNGPYNPCTFALSTTSTIVPSGAGSGSVTFTETGTCQWSISSDSQWLTITSPTMPHTGSVTVWYSYAANAGSQRIGNLTINGPTFTGNQLTITQSGPSSTDTISGTITLNGAGMSGVTVTLTGSQNGSTSTNSSGYYSFTGLPAGGNYTVTPTMSGYTMSPASQYFPNLTSNQTANFTATASGGSGLKFFTVTPCRLADTSIGTGRNQGGTITLNMYGYCGIPANAAAYSLSITAVPQAGYLGILTTWPAGQQQPGVSTLNSYDGRTVTNAAIVPAGSGGAINVNVTDAAEVKLDVNGYFATSTYGYGFTALTPCRIADTRAGAGFSGSFGPPSMYAGQERDFTIPSGGSPTTPCNAPVAAAYSLNFTVTNPGADLTAWAAGTYGFNPLSVSTLSDAISANNAIATAAIVPVSGSGAIAVEATSRGTEMLFDINGYFSSGGYKFYPVTPCRIADTRPAGGKSGAFGPPSMAANAERDFPIPSSSCGIPSNAVAYSLNFTIVPFGYMGTLTAWPQGQPRPNASTLNDWTGIVLSNAAIVPAGTNGGIAVWTEEATDLLFDINGYFAP